jgi:hypothetical protein
MLPRCPHGIYSPDGDGLPARYCQACTPPVALTDEEKKLALHRFDPYPYGEKKCPRCGSLKFKFYNDYEFHCKDCGFDALKD